MSCVWLTVSFPRWPHAAHDSAWLSDTLTPRGSRGRSITRRPSLYREGVRGSVSPTAGVPDEVERSNGQPASTPREKPARAEKSCARCGAVKPRAEFLSAPQKKDGLSSWCRSCHNAAVRRWRARNRDEYNRRQRVKYRERHREARMPWGTGGIKGQKRSRGQPAVTIYLSEGEKTL
jgi:hypothetical protein